MWGMTDKIIILLAICIVASRGGKLYEIYNEGGIVNPQGPALRSDQGPQFVLNGKPFHILGGTIQYFRHPPEYWRDRMRKLKAVGANTIETYVAWNLHEPQPGHFDFTGHLDVKRFLEMAQEEDLFVILRPGPYIGSEWDFGGLPSWLLRNAGIKMRTSDPLFTSAVQAFFEKLLPQLINLQFTKGGGIIMVQVENEYGSLGVDDQPYLVFLKNLLQQQGIVELLVTCDSCTKEKCRKEGSPPGMLMSSNFQNGAYKYFNLMERMQPGAPRLVMEFWTGWFDYWGGKHMVNDVNSYSNDLSNILSYNASLVMYMFSGGRSPGFMSGASTQMNLAYLPIVSSYDYDAPLTEWGGYTPKYYATKSIFAEFSKGKFWDVPLPALPPETIRRAYGRLHIEKYLNLKDLLALTTAQTSHNVVPMELLDLNNNAGQSYGFIVYQTSIKVALKGSKLTIVGRVKDYAKIYVDDVLLGSFTWFNLLPVVLIPGKLVGWRELRIVVENSGRGAFGTPIDFTCFTQCKGLKDPVKLDLKTVTNWSIYPLEFNQDYIKRLSGAPWKPVSAPTVGTYPALFATTLTINDPPQDTFIDTQGWSKGIVIVNQVVLGRYWSIGPQQTLYLPAPLLVQGENKIYLLELGPEKSSILEYGFGASSIYLTDTNNLGPPLQYDSITFALNIVKSIAIMLLYV